MLAVVITIDTEADHRGVRWLRTIPLQFRSITRGIPDCMAPIFRAHGARPTYLLTTEVMDDPQSVEVLRRASDAELGTHLHGDYVPPGARSPVGTQSKDYTCFYPPAIERAKLTYITDQFRQRFGHGPTAYRAGCYAASGHTARVLAELGYLAETSVTPRMRWVNEQHPEHVLEFEHAPLHPYHPSEADLTRPGELGIWEVPVTIVPGPPPRRLATWLRPSVTRWPWLRWIIGQLAARARDELVVANIMFHSMEVIADASPYSPTERAAARIARRLDRMLRLLARHDAQFFTLSELAELLSRQEARARVA